VELKVKLKYVNITVKDGKFEYIKRISQKGKSIAKKEKRIKIYNSNE